MENGKMEINSKPALAKMDDYVENILFLAQREQELLNTVEPLTLEERAELESVQKQLDQDAREVKDKADHYGYAWKKLERYVDDIDTEIKRLQARKKSFDSQVSSLKFRLQSAFEILGLDRLKTALFTFGFRSSQTVEVGCPVDMLPAEFQRTKTVVEPDKLKLKDALKGGQTVAGVELVSHKTITLK